MASLNPSERVVNVPVFSAWSDFSDDDADFTDDESPDTPTNETISDENPFPPGLIRELQRQTLDVQSFMEETFLENGGEDFYGASLVDFILKI